MDVVTVILVTALALALHALLFVLFRRWMDRNLSIAAEAAPTRGAGCVVAL
jgi:hypothetical protein